VPPRPSATGSPRNSAKNKHKK